MAPSSIDLDAYCARVGYDGPRAPTLAALAGLHLAHVCAIPFENLSPLLGEPVPLDAAALQDKLVARRRGGWCFEHNLLFAHVLRAIGFEVATLGARVRWNVPPGVATPRSHCLLQVAVEGSDWIADVGFGGLTLTAPLRLDDPGVQRTPHEPHRLAREGAAYALEAQVAGEWQRLYVFDLVPQLQADYEVSNWYLAHHPESQFLKGVIAARAGGDRRHALRHTRYSVHHRDGTTERRFVGDVGELKRILAEDLRIPLPDTPRLDEVLAQAVRADAPAPRA